MGNPGENIDWIWATDACRAFVKSHGINLEDKKLLLAVSGGMDSMCMLSLCAEMGLDVGVAHMNYRLRGADSEGDAAFVRSTCIDRGLEYYETIVELKEKLGENGSGLQEKARNTRYLWLEKVRSEHGFDAICTAHHQDDAIETFFINLIRGTGIKGLVGIPFQRGYIVRPMLCFTREQISTLVTVSGLKYREDTTNADDAYLRNRIRHHIVPLFKSERDNFGKVMWNNQIRLTGEHALLEAYLAELSDRLCVVDKGVLQIDRQGLLDTASADLVLLYLLRDYGFNLNQCRHIVAERNWSGGRYLSVTHELILHRNHVQVHPHDHFDELAFTFQKGDSIVLPDGELNTEQGGRPELSSDGCIEFVDSGMLGEKLLLRHWTPGDYFYPLGTRGRQKLQDFFTNEKLSPADKARAWILISNAEVVWIIGMRIDDRYKVSESTTQILKLTWTPF